MAFRGGLKAYRITVPANGVQTRAIRGAFIFMKSASFAVEIGVEEKQVGTRGGEAYFIAMRQGEKWFTESEFDTLHVRNLQAAEMTVEIIVGFGEYAREVPERISTADENVSTAHALAAANTPELLVDERTFRKRVTLQARLANVSVCRVAESAAAIAAGNYLELVQGSGVTWESKTAVYVQSATIGDIVTAVEEIWND